MAESTRDEIAKLESMYAANPEGRVFTHLAEAYRKAGDLVRAREVLEDGLGRHSDSASGYVVLGRVMQDMGQVQEATAAFARVLELDPENRVALRALGELARAAGDNDQALAHFRQLQVLDPSDESLEAVLAELKSGPATVAPPAAEPAPEPASFEGAFEAPEATTSLEATPATPSAELGGLDVGSLAAAHDVDTSAPFDVSSLGAISGADAAQDLAPEPVRELQLPPVDGGWTGAAQEAEAAAWPGMAEPEAPPQHAEGGAAGAEVAGEEPSVGLPQGTETSWLAAQAPGEPESAAPVETPAEWETAEPTEVVTETMAELYRSQGHLDRAVEVYRALLRDRPGDEQLERKLLELELAILSPDAAAAASAPAEVGEDVSAQPVESPPAEPVAQQAQESEEPLQAQGEVATEPEPWAAPVEAEAAVEDATPHEELPEPWAEGAAAAAAAAELASFAPEQPAELVQFEPEPVTFGEEAPAEPEAPAATSSPEAAVPAMEAVWASGGDVPEDEPSPYDFQAPEEEVGPPVSAYLRTLLAWRRTSPAEGAYAPAAEEPLEAPAGFEPAFYEPPAQDAAEFQAPAGYEASTEDEQGLAAPPVEPPAGFEAGEVEPWQAAAAEFPAQDAVPEDAAAALPEEWLDTPAPAAESVEEASWSAPTPEATWAEEAAAVTEEPASAAPPPAGDLDWLTGPNGVAPETPPPLPRSPADDSERGERGDGPTDDDDLEMFRAWLQSLKK